MLLDEIEAVVQDGCRKLLQISRPPIRFYLLTDVMERPLDDTRVKRTLRECATYQPRLRLLQKLRPDGTWPIPRERKLAEDAGPGAPVGWTYITMYATSTCSGNIRR